MVEYCKHQPENNNLVKKLKIGSSVALSSSCINQEGSLLFLRVLLWKVLIAITARVLYINGGLIWI